MMIIINSSNIFLIGITVVKKVQPNDGLVWVLHGSQECEPKDQRVLEVHGPTERHGPQVQHGPGLEWRVLQVLVQREPREQSYAQLR